MTQETLLDSRNTNNTVYGLQFDCPTCNRTYFLYNVILDGEEECECGTDLGPVTLTFEE